jgi:formylglycine-generating enzyme required for sulfatase activity
MATSAALLIATAGLASWYLWVYLPKQRQVAAEEAQRKGEIRKAQEAQAAKAAELARATDQKRKADEAAAEEARKKRESVESLATATKEHPWTNSLGLKFVPVPGTNVLFAIWDTRVRDYETFGRESGRKPPEVRSGCDVGTGFGSMHLDYDIIQSPLDPAVNVSWEDANAFCQWLTNKEHEAGTLPSEKEYRLPTDAEWSTAVGLSSETGQSPRQKDSKIKGVYGWGQGSPPQGAGNYAPNLKVDTYEFTSPVGSFSANKYGLYDMGGNVSQWCEDLYDQEHKSRVLRGASWVEYMGDDLLLSRRIYGDPNAHFANYGFRVVVAGSASAH